MTNQPENENQQTVTPEEVRQSLLAELEASQQAISELNDEELEEVAGGAGLIPWLKAFVEQKKIFGNSNVLGRTFEVSKEWTPPLTKSRFPF